MTKHSRWGDLFDLAASILDKANATYPLIDSWTLGGGTALMLHLDHRESFDIDIFLDDPQYLPYLNPQVQGYQLEISPDDYVSDGSRVLKVVFANIGEIDFICAPGLTDAPATTSKVHGRDILLETPAEIIAKKIYYRGASMQPRDMFDIACVVKILGTDYAVNALRPFRQESEKALIAAQRMNKEFAAGIMEKLLYQPNFKDLPKDAQAITIDLLNKLCC